jgi:hypothetical protein
LSGDIEALPDAGKVIIGLGAARLMLRLRGIQGSHLMPRSKYLKARASELEAIQISAEQGRAAGNISEKPLLVLTAGSLRRPNLVQKEVLPM